jgi:hypothetical protein
VAASLRRACALAIAVAIAPVPCAVATPNTTVTALADREGVILESPQTNAAGESEWTKICALPCEHLQLDPWLPYRITGANVLTSESFQLRGYGQNIVLDVHAKTTAELGTARGLFYGGLAGMAVGAALLTPGVIFMAQGCSSPMEGPCLLGTGVALAFAGGITALAGIILTIVGGVKLGDCNTTVSIAPKPL